MSDYEVEAKKGVQAFRGGIPFNENRSDAWRRGWMIGKDIYGIKPEDDTPIIVKDDNTASMLVVGAIGLGFGLLF